MDALKASIAVATSGLAAQSERLRIVSENLANANSTGVQPGSDPYRRKTIIFAAELDRATGASLVGVRGVGIDRSDFPVEHDPAHPAADSSGTVKVPNVNMLVEMADMRDANRAYEANLSIVKQAREVIDMTISLLKSSG
jgi:flagellar basal-body rod protein FlgC